MLIRSPLLAASSPSISSKSLSPLSRASLPPAPIGSVQAECECPLSRSLTAADLRLSVEVHLPRRRGADSSSVEARRPCEWDVRRRDVRSVVAGASDWERLAVGRVERIGRGEAGVEFVPSVRGAMRVAIGGEAGSRELLVIGGRGEVVKGASEVQGLSRVSRAEDGAVLSSTSRSQG